MRLVGQLARWRAETAASLGADAVGAALEEEHATRSQWNLLAEVEHQTRPIPVATPADRVAPVAAVMARAVSPARWIRVARAQAGAGPAAAAARERHADDRAPRRGAVHHPAVFSLPRPFCSTPPANKPHCSCPYRWPGRPSRNSSVPAVRLEAGQCRARRTLATDHRRLALAIGPDGASKTTALRASFRRLGRRRPPGDLPGDFR